MNVYEEVGRLIDQVRILVPDRAAQEMLDIIGMRCRAFMEPDAHPNCVLKMTPMEGQIFELLRKRCGVVLSFGMLSDSYNRGGDADSLRVHISHIRRKLVGTEYEGKIKSVNRVGYSLAV